jgi:hypothetical protein
MAAPSTSRSAGVRPSTLRFAGWGLVAIAALLLPWVAVLALTLPATAHARNWVGAWIGFDLMESIGLAVTGWLVLRRDLRVVIAASATAAFLIADAWFDVATSQPDWDLAQATILAFAVELPLAAICCVIALTATRWCPPPSPPSGP